MKLPCDHPAVAARPLPYRCEFDGHPLQLVFVSESDPAISLARKLHRLFALRLPIVINPLEHGVNILGNCGYIRIWNLTLQTVEAARPHRMNLVEKFADFFRPKDVPLRTHAEQRSERRTLYAFGMAKLAQHPLCKETVCVQYKLPSTDLLEVQFLK